MRRACVVGILTRCCRHALVAETGQKLLLKRNFDVFAPDPVLLQGSGGVSLFRERRQSSGQDLYSTMRAGPDRLTWGGDRTLHL